MNDSFYNIKAALCAAFMFFRIDFVPGWNYDASHFLLAERINNTT